MRVTPAQGAMLMICGEQYPRFPGGTLEERIAKGHEILVRCSDIDFGKDLNAWHEHLSLKGLGGYTWDNGHLKLQAIIEKVLNNEEWQKAASSVFNQQK